MKRKLLIVIGDLDVGGTARHLTRVLPHLNRDIFQITVCTLTHKGVLAPMLEQAGISVVEPWGGTWVRRLLPKGLRLVVLLPLTVLHLMTLLRCSRPDVVHFFLPMAYLIGGVCAILTKTRWRVMSRRSLAAYQKSHPFLARMERLLHARMCAVLGNSKAVLQELRGEGVPEEKLGLIYNGVEHEKAASGAEKISREELLPSHNIDDKAVVFILVANLIYYKGHENLLRAFGQIRASLPKKWALLCVGRDDGIGADLMERARDNKIFSHVRWLGPRSDTAALLAASDIGLLCSDEEGFSNSILEAMAAGLPMVVTNVGGNAEAVKDGETGFVVPPQDPARLGEAILTLVKDPGLCRQMGDAGRARIAKAFSTAACVKNYERLYTGLIAGENKAIGDLIQREGN